jgi:hypothetical protein
VRSDLAKITELLSDRKGGGTQFCLGGANPCSSPCPSLPGPVAVVPDKNTFIPMATLI